MIQSKTQESTKSECINLFAGNFPSKRRDHHEDRQRKMCSTDKPFVGGPFPPEFLTRLYSEQLGYPLNGDRLPLPFSGLGFPGLPYPFLGNGLDRKEPSRSSTPSSPASPALSDVELPTPDRDGRLPCRYCSMPCSDAAALRDHISVTHSSELYRCAAPGCNKAYTSRAARNRHSERHERQTERHDSSGGYDTARRGSAGSASSAENGS